MNRYKKFKIVDYIRSKGKLPTDPYGQFLNLDDMLVWYGLEGKLDEMERAHIKHELKKMIETELFTVELESGW
ncbi:MAG: hypothetical protein DRP56_01615 [Planctomycetota bacterium]|nr:MAG: hypothetical protein DRP56_01615 [Planctomycetota bacterium]